MLPKQLSDSHLLTRELKEDKVGIEVHLQKKNLQLKRGKLCNSKDRQVLESTGSVGRV